MTRHQQPRSGQKPVQNERNSLGKPQLFVQLTFGVSWSDRYMPQTHTIGYTSKHLKNARSSGHFPRQDPYHHQQHRRQDSSSQRQYRSERQQQQQHRDRDRDRVHERPRGRPSVSRSRYAGAMLSPPRDLRSESRRGSNERGNSAPPVVHDGLWGDDDDDEGGPSATLFPRPVRSVRTAPQVWKDLPTNPARFRLGEDGLPWSASAWPFDGEGEGEDDDEEGDSNDDDNSLDDERRRPYANRPTTLPLPPPSTSRSEDPMRVKELESLSTAMVTVDNGFENQWWNQGTREAVSWFPSDSPVEDADGDDMCPLSPADAVLLSAAEPPSAVEAYSPHRESFRDIVSPLSDAGPSFNMSSPLRRSFSTRSDELWMDR